jgi:hypothetical protein
MARSVLLIFYKELKNALALTAILGFLPTAAKSKQKVPLEGNALHPLIYSFLQVVMIRSRQAITQSPVHGDCPAKMNK